MSGASHNNQDRDHWTILRTLEWTTGFFEEKGLGSPRLDAEMLLAEALGMPRIQLYAQHDRPLMSEERDRLRELVRRRARREPMAYILGQRGFWTLDLKTDARALIPRPDTERLVELALGRLPKDTPLRGVDVGTGTGAIALALLSERPRLEMAATDLSADALALAAENASALKLEDRLELVEGDLLEGLDPARWANLDVLVSNPPYVSEGELTALMPDVRDHEPHLALVAGPEGLDVIRRLVPQALGRLRSPGGWLFVEIGHQQGAAVKALFEEAGFKEVRVDQDYNDKDRVVSGRT